MNIRLLGILAVVVALIGGAAYYFGQERKALQSEAFQAGPLLPGVEDRINDVDAIRIESQEGGVLNFKRSDAGWTLAERYGYRANRERVATILKQVATLKAIEPKTSKPENHKRLNLDDPAGEFSLATRITLKAGDALVADVVVGLNRPEKQGGGAFVRLWGEDQTWLTEADFKPRRRALDLLDRNVVNVDGRRIRTARLSSPPASADSAVETLAVGKSAPDQEKYSLAADIPEGMTPKADSELSTVARVSDFLVLEDVWPATEAKMDSPNVAVYETFDGLRLTYRAQAQSDGKVWVTVAAEAADRSPDLDAFVAANKGQDSESGRIADQFKTPEEIQAEIAEISKNVDGWAYKLTDYKIKRLTMKAAELIEKAEEPAEAPKAQ